MLENRYQICSNCVMDTTDRAIEFDESGVCCHCHHYHNRIKTEIPFDRKEKLEQLIKRIKQQGRGKEYDCIVGISGGVDSAVAACTAKQMGLRPLAVHMDNGWNAELAVANVERVLKGLDIDLHTHVLDWEEFRDLQCSFLRSSLANAEIPTDHAILASLYKIATRLKIQYIISGSNIVTEAIMPGSWMYDATDLKLIKDIHRKFGQFKLKTYPSYSLPKLFYWIFFKRIRFVPILNYVSYIKKDTVDMLHQEFGWRSYGAKHYESIYTRFFQSYILPRKFNIDKRKAHFSTLICSQQMSRKEALRELQSEPCSPQQIEEDREFVIKKLQLSEQEFKDIMEAPIKTFKDYSSNHFWLNSFPSIIKFIKKIGTDRK